jgi:hypothetical protein
VKAKKALPTVILGDGEKGMLQRAVLRTLHAELERGLTTEPQVAYFLVQLRKLMDQQEGPADYTVAPTKFFCDWALHLVITRKSGLLLLQAVDQAFGKSIDEASQLLGSTFSMEAFREHLIHQLSAHRLPTGAIQKMQPWLEFLRLYIGIIANSPILDCNAKLQYIDRLQVRLDETEVTDVPQGAAFAFTIVWTFSKCREPIFEWRNRVVHPIDPKPARFYQLSG